MMRVLDFVSVGYKFFVFFSQQGNFWYLKW